MAELQPPESQVNGGGGALVVGSTENVGTKRQRRPSVRLGDIGEQPYETTTHHVNRRTIKQWKLPVKDSSAAAAACGGKVSSKTRAVMNLPNSENYPETLDGEDKDLNLDSVAIGSWKIRDFKSKRGSTKRVRSNWVSPKLDEGVGGGGVASEADDKFSGGEDVDDGYRDFEPQASESPRKECSPVNSMDIMDTDLNRVYLRRRGNSAGVRVSRDHHDGVELDGPSDTDCRNWNNPERNGVRVWLNQLGLGRYAPVFEIHEVDDEVLPMLTLEDLKDMGINAVGSRRKMYCSIQKLGKGFS